MSAESPSSCAVPSSVISVNATAWLLEGLLRIVLACIAFASLIYCYHYAAQHPSRATVVYIIADITNLPMGVYQLAKWGVSDPGGTARCHRNCW